MKRRRPRYIRSVIQRLYERLCQNPYVRHPVVDEWLIDEDLSCSGKTDKLRDLLKTVSQLDDIRYT